MQKNLMQNGFLRLAKLLLNVWHESNAGHSILVHFVCAVLAVGHRHDFYTPHSLVDSAAVQDYRIHYRSRIQIDWSNFNTAFQIGEGALTSNSSRATTFEWVAQLSRYRQSPINTMAPQ